MFNPANFNVAKSIATPVLKTDPTSNRLTAEVAQKIKALEQAAARFAIRRDSFAAGKSETCLDIAAKLERFGSFASEKQAEFADKLVAWSLPRQYSAVIEATVLPPVDLPKAPVIEERKATTLPKLFDLMQRLSKLTIGDITIARKNQDSLCWIKLEGVEKVVGRIVDGGVVTLFARQDNTGRMVDQPALLSRLAAIETDPEAAAVRHGKASGRCSICSRDLTDPVSIERGIGPICIGKAGW